MGIFDKEPYKLVGNKLKKGDKAPNFKLYDITMDPKTLDDWKGKVIILSILPSIDTGVCDIQAKKFLEKYENDDEVVLINISVDLPFAFSRWCQANNKKAIVLTDYRTRQFGKDYGVLMDPHMTLFRAIFVIDRDGIITYAAYNDVLTDHPDYEAAFKAVDETK
ncbi:MAG: thiol peroxidase [Mycoplasmoidaceae bacterium]